MSETITSPAPSVPTPKDLIMSSRLRELVRLGMVSPLDRDAVLKVATTAQVVEIVDGGFDLMRYRRMRTVATHPESVEILTLERELGKGAGNAYVDIRRVATGVTHDQVKDVIENHDLGWGYLPLFRATGSHAKTLELLKDGVDGHQYVRVHEYAGSHENTLEVIAVTGPELYAPLAGDYIYLGANGVSHAEAMEVIVAARDKNINPALYLSYRGLHHANRPGDVALGHREALQEAVKHPL
ncbi:hypothetical protein GCM10023195_47100 [Actinoallomurus liliacearum]|uniref:Uncharacterized protein n=1 Tax=Actinoallomurus liliacearum TaxID=1080073 RepID=A0ABP8TLH1_9ACTN